MAENTQLGPEAVAHMASLSRLAVSPEEEALFARQFADILGYMEVLSRVDTSQVEPLFSPVQHEGVTREDLACNRRAHEEVLANAPDADGQYFIVPRIV
ncbi:MAG: Asp-tRNA(Asn)/Glu-tRNA(Gln) amidotransferase subunit GatC [Desulfovibrionaceae bacterium]|nr:Asp-tRNA(Asn)/Glu-tRNA(Gln) amidotransferase subunit GatC [Desulfovibrionaceae bacterium]